MKKWIGLALLSVITMGAVLGLRMRRSKVMKSW